MTRIRRINTWVQQDMDLKISHDNISERLFLPVWQRAFMNAPASQVLWIMGTEKRQAWHCSRRAMTSCWLNSKCFASGEESLFLRISRARKHLGPFGVLALVCEMAAKEYSWEEEHDEWTSLLVGLEWSGWVSRNTCHQQRHASSWYLRGTSSSRDWLVWVGRRKHPSFALSECEIHPTTVFLRDPTILEEAARSWVAGYKIGNYRLVPSNQVPKEFLETGMLSEDCVMHRSLLSTKD